MKRLFWLLLPLAFFLLPAPHAHAQAEYGDTNPLDILTNDDISTCTPQNADKSTSAWVGCCGSPGRRSCATGYLTFGLSPVCLSVASTLKGDPYGSTPLCTMSAPGIDSNLGLLVQSGTDMTFYVTSDIHFFRSTFNLSDQLTHVKVLNSYPSTNPVWPTGVGALTNTAVASPLALIVDGDITTHGLPQDLGAYRLLYEESRIPDSIAYPVLFGLGNHDINTDNTADDAHRMFDYLQARMANTHMDSGSGNYSWDWQGVHMIQLNTWAGDQMNKYVHTSDGLTWLKNDLATYVGATTRPVVIFQHYGLSNVGSIPAYSTITTPSWWPTDAAALDVNQNATGKGYESFFNIVKNYNLIGMFSGHTHCLGIYTSNGVSNDGSYNDGSQGVNVPLGGSLFPAIVGYGQSIDDFDDGSGGDTGDGQNSAGNGNDCGNNQAGVASFLTTHINQHYLDVAAVSWTGDGSAPYSDTTIGFPDSKAGCRKRINSQFIPVPASVMLTTNGNQYTVKNTSGTAINVPIALQFQHGDTPGNYDFVDTCGDPGNHEYVLVNGESGLAAGQTVTRTSTLEANHPPTAYLLTPLSGATPNNLLHTTAYAANNNTAIAPGDDTVLLYGPPNQTFTVASPSYLTSITGWLQVSPMSGNFDGTGKATIDLHYVQTALQETQEANALAQVFVTTGGIGTVQEIQTGVDFKAPVTLTLTANPANNFSPISANCSPSTLATVPGCEAEFTVSAAYTPIASQYNGDGTILLSGVMNLFQVDPVSGAMTSLSTGIVNTTNDCNEMNIDPQNTVVFGSPANGDNLCPTFTGSSAPGQIGSNTFSSATLAPGVYNLVAAYQGSEDDGNGQGDSLYAPAVSAPLLYRVGDALSGFTKNTGDKQSAPAGEYFNTPLSVKVNSSTTSQGGPVNAIVTFEVKPSQGGASGSFSGSQSATVYADGNGIATAPPIVANAVTGSWQVTASVAGIGNPLSFGLANGPAQAPNIQAVIFGKSGTFPTRNWRFELTNTGGIAAGQLSVNQLTFTQKSGAACSPKVTQGLPFYDPILYATAPDNTVGLPVTIDFTGCALTDRFTVTLGLTGNNGAYSEQLVIANQFP
jgi:hypothetical protein